MKVVWCYLTALYDNDNLAFLPPVVSPRIHSGHFKTPSQPIIIGLLEHLEQGPAKKAKESINFYFCISIWDFFACLKVNYRERGPGSR